jgi:hypothetical protein
MSVPFLLLTLFRKTLNKTFCARRGAAALGFDSDFFPYPSSRLSSSAQTGEGQEVNCRIIRSRRQPQNWIAHQDKLVGPCDPAYALANPTGPDSHQK